MAIDPAVAEKIRAVYQPQQLPEYNIPVGNKAFDYVRNTIKSYGYTGKQSEAQPGGLKYADDSTMNNLIKIASYNWQTGNSGTHYGTAVYNPWLHPTDVNKAMGDFVSVNHRAPTPEEFGSYYTANVKYKGKYENTAEDQANMKNGLPPAAVQAAQKAQTKLDDLQNKFKAFGPGATYAQAQARNLRDRGYDNSAAGSGAPAGAIPTTRVFPDQDLTWQATPDGLTSSNDIKSQNGKNASGHYIIMPQADGSAKLAYIPAGGTQPENNAVETFSSPERAEAAANIYSKELQTGQAWQSVQQKFMREDENKNLNAITNGPADIPNTGNFLKDTFILPFERGIQNIGKVYNGAANLMKGNAFTANAAANALFGTPMQKDVVAAHNADAQKFKDNGMLATTNPLFNPLMNNAPMASITAAGDAAAMGLPNLLQRQLDAAKQKRGLPVSDYMAGINAIQAQHPVASAIGTIAGSALPIGGAESLAGKAIEELIPAAEPLLKEGIRGAVSFSLPNLVSDINKGVPAEQTVTDLITNIAMGGLGNPAFKMLNEAVGGWIPAVGTKAYEDMLKSGELAQRLTPYAERATKALARDAAAELNQRETAQADQANAADHTTADNGAAQNTAMPDRAGAFEKGLLGDQAPAEAAPVTAIDKTADTAAAANGTNPGPDTQSSAPIRPNNAPSTPPENLTWTNTPGKTTLTADAGNGQAYTVTKQDGQYSARLVDASTGKVVKDIGTFDTQELAQGAAKSDLKAAGEKRFGEALGNSRMTGEAAGKGRNPAEGIDFQREEGNVEGGGENNNIRNDKNSPAVNSKSLTDAEKFAELIRTSSKKDIIDAINQNTLNGFDNSSIRSLQDAIYDSDLSGTDKVIADQALYKKAISEGIETDMQAIADPSYVYENGDPKWADNDGFAVEKNGKTKSWTHIPQVDEIVDRFGDDGGRFVSPIKNGKACSFLQRALPYIKNMFAYHKYIIIKDFDGLADAISNCKDTELQRDVLSYMHEKGITFDNNKLNVREGVIAQCFANNSGGGLQWMFPLPIDILRDLGFIREIK